MCRHDAAYIKAELEQREMVLNRLKAQVDAEILTLGKLKQQLLQPYHPGESWQLDYRDWDALDEEEQE